MGVPLGRLLHPALDDRAVVGVAGVEDRDVLGAGDRGDLLVVLDRVDVGDDLVERRELRERHRAERRLPREHLGDHLEHLVVGRGGRLDREVVDAEEVLGPLPVGARHPQQPPLELVAEPRAGLVEQLVVVERQRDAVSPSRSVSSTARTKNAHSGSTSWTDSLTSTQLGVEVRAAGRRGVGSTYAWPRTPAAGSARSTRSSGRGAEHPLPERQGGVAARAVAVAARSVLPREAPAGDGDRPGRRLHHEVEGR